MRQQSANVLQDARAPGPVSAAVAAVLVLLLPLMFWQLAGEAAATAVIDWVQVGCGGLALGFATATLRRGGAERRELALLVAALTTLLLADTGWAWVDSVRGEDPSASSINWLYLPFYPLVLAAVVAFPRVLHSPADRLRFALDAAIVALGVGLLLWDRVAQPHLPVLASDSTALTLFVLLGQPLLDCIAALAVAVLLLRLPAGAGRRPMLWLALALSLNLLGNLVLAVLAADSSFVTGGIADALWIGSRWAFLAAAESLWRCHRDTGEIAPEREWRPSFTLLPYVAVLAGYATVLHDALDEGVSLANIGGSILLTALVLLRQAVDRRETEGLLAERARRAGESRLAALVEHASEAILVLDRQRLVSYASPAAAQLLGVAADALRGLPFGRFLHPEESLAAATLLAGESRPGPSRQALLRLRRDPGWIWTECTITDLLSTPDVDGIVLNVRDVSAQRELEEQLRHQSFHDPLTGLINRLLFGERISEALTERRADGSAMAVMFIDLDHFKVVNDSLGHGSGDAVIGQAALRLEAAVCERDVVLARLGGDEFALLLQDLHDDAEVVDIAQRVMGAFRLPFRIDDREVPLSVSLGIAWAAPTDTVDVLLRNADLALNEAKARGRDRFHVFQPDLHAAVLRKLKLHGALRELLDRNGFSLAYQPILRLGDLAPVGVEALLRWQPQAGIEANTSDAVAAAEESGLIVPLGRWVLERALREMQQLRDEHGVGADLRLTVNLSPRQLYDGNLAQVIAAALQATATPPGLLVLELTESAVAEGSDEALAALLRLKALGLRLAIDDFGTGYSSLAHLARFPFDLLKVAKPFVDMIGPDGNADGTRLARAVLALGASLRLQTIAEGIEHPRQLALLREAGCELGQGFMLARPLALLELVAFLRQARAADLAAPFPVVSGTL